MICDKCRGCKAAWVKVYESPDGRTLDQWDEVLCPHCSGAGRGSVPRRGDHPDDTDK